MDEITRKASDTAENMQLYRVVRFFHQRTSCTTTHISADILGWKNPTTGYILLVTGFTSDFLSFIVVELIRFFHGAIQLYYCKISCSKRGSVALWLRQWTSIHWTRVCFHCNPYESSVPPLRASGQNSSRAPEKYHFARWHFQAFVNEGVHNITVIAFSALRLLVWHQEGNHAH